MKGLQFIFSSGFLVCSALLSSGVAQAGGYDIAKANDCFKCHEIDRGIKGPSFQYIGNAYRGRNDAQGRIKNPIRNGIKFYYFWEKMPANHKMSEAELNELTQWILSQ